MTFGLSSYFEVVPRGRDPLLAAHQDRPEDLDTEAKDNAADSSRYACNVPPVDHHAARPERTRTLARDRKLRRGRNVGGRSVRVSTADQRMLKKLWLLILPHAISPRSMPGGSDGKVCSFFDFHRRYRRYARSRERLENL